MKLNGDIIKNEPVLITGLVSAVIALGLAFGLQLDEKQIGAIMAVVAILLAIGARMFVTPDNKLPVAPDPETPMFPEEPAAE
jgi:hypothetical protein